MEVKVEEISSIKKRLNIEIPKIIVDKERASTFQNYKKRVKIKGFRPGKIPRDILERQYGKQIEDETISRIINDTYSKTIKEHDIPVISSPVIDSQKLEKEGMLRYVAVVEVKPEPDIEGYLGLEAEKETLNVTDQDVEENLRRLQGEHAELKEVEENRPLKNGDYAFIECQMIRDGNSVEKEKKENFSLEIGSNSFLPGFDEQLVGLSKNLEKLVEVNLPEDYQNKDRAGKKVNFYVKLKQIKEKILPELDDEFAKDIGDFQSLNELRDRIKKNLKTREEARIKNTLIAKIIDKIIEKNQFEVPPSMIDTRINYMIETMKMRIKSQGADFEKLGISREKMRENYRGQAEREIRTSFILESIAKKESIKPSGEEIEEKVKEIAKKLGQSPERVKEFYQNDRAIQELKSQILEEKTIDFLIGKTKILNIDRPG